MKNPNSHIILYAKGHYEKSEDIWTDMKILIAHRSMLPLELVSRNDVVHVVLDITLDLILQSEMDNKTELSRFIIGLNPVDIFHRPIEEDYPTRILKKCLSIIKFSKVEEGDKVFIELDDLDPEILPINPNSIFAMKYMGD